MIRCAEQRKVFLEGSQEGGMSHDEVTDMDVA